MNADLDWFKLQRTTKHLSKSFPQFLLAGPVLWSVLAKLLYLSVPLYCTVRNTIFLEDDIVHAAQDWDS